MTSYLGCGTSTHEGFSVSIGRFELDLPFLLCAFCHILLLRTISGEAVSCYLIRYLNKPLCPDYRRAQSITSEYSSSSKARSAGSWRTCGVISPSPFLPIILHAQTSQYPDPAFDGRHHTRFLQAFFRGLPDGLPVLSSPGISQPFLFSLYAMRKPLSSMATQ